MMIKTSTFLYYLFVILTLSLQGVYAQLPPDFIEVDITNEIHRPVGITFDDNGQAYVWERNGVVHVIDSTGEKLADPLLDISEEVGAWGDHGCLGFALHPGFTTNGYFYLLYVVDRHHLIHFGTDQYVPDSTLTMEATIGRITRYTADSATNFTTILPNSRKVLLGETIDSGFPVLMASHGVGSLAFGTDGTLLASCGDAGSFLTSDIGSDPGTYYEQALADGIIREKENVGSLRSQMIDCLNGKIIRIDPETGDGIPSNPYYDPQNPRSAASRVWSLGLRNPFRFKVRPETGSHNPEDGDPGTLFIGDVGSSIWEELNLATGPGQNFGYPFFEGYDVKTAFWDIAVANPDAPNPLFADASCQQAYFNFQELIQQANPAPGQTFQNSCDENIEIDPALTFYHALPKIIYNNSISNKPARAYVAEPKEGGGLDTVNIAGTGSTVSGDPFGGYTSVAGIFYEGEAYPESYHGKYFHADYAWWIKTMDFDDNNDFSSVEDFHDHAEYILDMAVNPKDDCIYYVGFQSIIRKIVYGGNAPPVADFEMDKPFGPAPLEVNFDASASYDPEGTELSYLWDFGDGSTSQESKPIYIFESVDNNPKPFYVKLTVTDSLGAVDSLIRIVSLNNTPPEVKITSFEDGSYYSVNGFTILPLAADVSDLEHGAAELSYSWQTFLQHNTHEHAEPPDHQPVTSTIIEPIGCNEENYWFRIILEVTDAAGLSSRDTAEIFPWCGDPPAELLDWHGFALEKSVVLNWETGAETDMDYYEVERITQSHGLSVLGQIEAKGSHSAYTLSDDSPVDGVNIYRLKMVDKNGVFDYSAEIKILFPPKKELTVYPNPASSQIFFDLRNIPELVNLEIFNYAGQLMYQTNWGEVNPFSIDISNWSTGIYFYRLKNGPNQHSGKIQINN